jgi:hypothetical protein
VINVAQSAPFESIYESGESGLLPGLEVAIFDNDGNVVFGPTDAIITENEVGGQPTGVYSAQFAAAPAALGQYTIIWSNDGTFDPNAGAGVEDLIVLTEAQSDAALPAIPSDDDSGLLWGPCTSWVSTDDIAACCTLPEDSNPEELIEILEGNAASASQLLWSLSGRQFSGLCQKRVRPCRVDDCGCEFQVLSRGHIVPPMNWTGSSWSCEGRACGCSGVSSVLLPGYPVREILEVLVDGDTVSPDDYFLREHRFLVHRDNGRWPSCQNMAVGHDEDGAFSVTYTYGQNVPRAGRDAAGQLACELFKACSNDDECVLPTSARRITRQGITIDATYFTRDENGRWVTGMPFVDAFLTAVNPTGLVRRPTFWAPGRRYARADS